MKITGFDKVIEMYDLKINIAMNEHSTCRFSAIIDEVDIAKYIEMAKSEKSVEISTESGLLLMKGIVQNIQIKKTYINTVIFVSIISNSITAERTFNKRIFQDTRKKVKDIIAKYNYNISIQKGEKLEENIEDIVVQDNENDFSFLKSLCAKYECGLWIESDGIVIGHINNKDSKDINGKIIDYNAIYTKDVDTYKLKCQEYIKNGSTINYDGKNLIITEVEITESFKEAYYLYTAVNKIDFSAYTNTQSSIDLGRGKVIKNTDKENKGRIQVEFLDYENICDNTENSYIMPYLTPFEGKDNCGFMMMPDIGDIVMVYVYNEKPVAIGTLREKEVNDSIKNIEHKTICIGKDRFIRFDDKDIYIQNTEESSLTISNKSINIKTKNGEISISQDKNCILLNKDSIKADSDNNITNAKKIAVKSSGNVEINASKSLNLSGATGASINGKTKVIIKGANIDLNN